MCALKHPFFNNPDEYGLEIENRNKAKYDKRPLK